MTNPIILAVALVGSSTCHLVDPSDKSSIETDLRERVAWIIRSLYGRGCRTFMSTLADGFSLWAFDTALMLRESGECPDLKLEVFICCERQDSDYDELQRVTYNDLVKKADKVNLIPEREADGCCICPGQRMLDYCSLLVTFTAAEDKKMQDTLAYARSLGITILDLCDWCRTY